MRISKKERKQKTQNICIYQKKKTMPNKSNVMIEAGYITRLPSPGQNHHQKKKKRIFPKKKKKGSCRKIVTIPKNQKVTGDINNHLATHNTRKCRYFNQPMTQSGTVTAYNKINIIGFQGKSYSSKKAFIFTKFFLSVFFEPVVKIITVC